MSYFSQKIRTFCALRFNTKNVNFIEGALSLTLLLAKPNVLS